MEMDRRTVLALLGGALAIPTTILAMRSCEGPGDDGDPDSGWALLERMRAALKTSPDHLAARADAVVANADARAVFAFVRDQIVNIPAPTTWNSNGVRWGARGALRSGMGTHLEKSVLLRDLLSKIGVEAHVVSGSLPTGFNRARLGLDREPPAFDPDVSTETLREWLQALGSAAAPQGQAATPYDLDALAARLSIAFDGGAAPPSVNWDRALTRMSLVQLPGGAAGTVWLNPNVTDATWGAHYLRDDPRPAREADDVPHVRVTVEVAGDDRPYWPEPVLTASWPFPQVLGSQVTLGFTPPGTPESMAGVPANELESFIPYLDVRGAEDASTNRPEFKVVGDAFTRQGRVVPRARAEAVAAQPALVSGEQSSVTSLELHAVRRAGYPRMAVEAWPRDANGDVVWGLNEDAFVLTEDGQPRELRVERNQPRPPRIFFAFDSSGSVPEDYRSRVATKALLRRVIASVRATHPDAEFNVASLGTRETLLHTRSGWLRNEEDLVAHIDQHYSGLSYAWSGLVGAVSSGADVVVLVSDATTTEATNPYWAERFQEGCPAIIWATRKDPTSATDVFEAMAERTKGAWFWGHMDPDPMLRKLEALLPATDHERPYVVSFRSLPGESTSHEGELSVNGHDVRMAFPISVPPVEARKPATKDELTGIHVTVAIGPITATRLIAGLPARSKASQDPFTEAVRDDIGRALFGSYQFTMEGGPPTTSALLDTILRAHLAKRPFFEAVQQENFAEALALAADPRVVRMPASYALLQAPVSGATGRGTYPEGHQIVMHSVRPGAAGTYEHECDVLPTLRWQAMGDDRQAARKHVQRVSLEMALREATLYPRSTLASMGSAPLVRVRVASNGAITVAAGTPVRNLWRSVGMRKVNVASSGIALVPASLKAGGWWWVDPSTGTTLGMLARGAGGGVAETEATFDAVSQMIDVFDFAFGKVGIGLGVWAKLEQAKLKHLKLATIAILKMDGSVTLGDFQALAAEQIKDELIGRIRGKVEDRLKDWMPPFAAMQDLKDWAEAGDKALRLALGPVGR